MVELTDFSKGGRVKRGREEDMSLAFSHDPVSKREKQEIFKKSLDDQRRMNQAAATSPCEHSSTSLDSRNGQDPNGINRRVPGLEGTGGPGLSGLEYHHHHHQQGASTPRFEGSASPRQQKQPYMSAVSLRFRSNQSTPLSSNLKK